MAPISETQLVDILNSGCAPEEPVKHEEHVGIHVGLGGLKLS